MEGWLLEVGRYVSEYVYGLVQTQTSIDPISCLHENVMHKPHIFIDITQTPGEKVVDDNSIVSTG